MRRVDRGCMRHMMWACVGLVLAAAAPLAWGEILHAHIIPHSHCDPGWLDTFEQYYLRDVKGILDGVVQQLSQDNTKRFVWAETSFFARWYEMQTGRQKEQFRKLVESGQLEFVGGGWSQHDEATPDHVAIMRQMTTGHQYLLQNFGVLPRVGWQIDPFGHSSATASLFALVGFDAMVINRIHFSIKAEFKNQRHMEFVWRGADVGAGRKSDIFTHVLHTHYSAPKGFDWEEGAIGVNSANVGMRAQELCRVLKQRANAYRTKHLLVPWGDDFKFKNAGFQFSNMDQLVREINSKSSMYGVKIQYSTVSEYFRHVHRSNTKFPVYTGDFYPYADNADSYWTGFYTTRPFMKAISRRLQTVLRAGEMLHSLVRSNPNPPSNPNPTAVSRTFWENQYQVLERARRNTGLFLHHDAITGTSRSTVVSDYMDRMTGSLNKILGSVRALLQHSLTKHPNPAPSFTHSPYTLAANSKKVYPIVLYNNLAWPRQELVSVRIGAPRAAVFDFEGNGVMAQIDPFWSDFSSRDPSSSVWVVHFIAQIPALGAVTYFVKVGAVQGSELTHQSTTDVLSSSGSLSSYFNFRGGGGAASSSAKNVNYRQLDANSELFLENGLLRVTFSPTTGLISSITHRKKGINIKASQTFNYYTTQRSGAYIFRPMERSKPVLHNRQLILRITKGKITNSFSLRFGEFDIVGSLIGGSDPELAGHVFVSHSVVARANQEIIIRFSTPLANNNQFYTHNGLEWVQRQRQEYPLSANFYPAVMGARILDANTNHRLTVNTFHTMGCASQGNGEIELMVHRSLNQDDGRGLAQAVMDGSRVDIPMWLTVDQMLPAGDDLDFRRRALFMNNPVLTLYGSDTNALQTTVPEWVKKHQTVYSPMEAEVFPKDVHLLSLTARDGTSDDIVFRLQHISKADTKFNKPLSSVFSKKMGFKAAQLRATTLTVNQEIPLPTYPKKRMAFIPEDGSRPQGFLSALFTSNAASKQESQNTDEEGVFISAAALQKMKGPLGNNANANSNNAAPAAQPGAAVSPLPLATRATSNDPGRFSNLFGRRLLSMVDHPRDLPLGAAEQEQADRAERAATAAVMLQYARRLYPYHYPMNFRSFYDGSGVRVEDGALTSPRRQGRSLLAVDDEEEEDEEEEDDGTSASAGADSEASEAQQPAAVPAAEAGAAGAGVGAAAGLVWRKHDEDASGARALPHGPVPPVAPPAQDTAARAGQVAATAPAPAPAKANADVEPVGAKPRASVKDLDQLAASRKAAKSQLDALFERYDSGPKERTPVVAEASTADSASSSKGKRSLSDRLKSFLPFGGKASGASAVDNKAAASAALNAPVAAGSSGAEDEDTDAEDASSAESGAASDEVDSSASDAAKDSKGDDAQGDFDDSSIVGNVVVNPLQIRTYVCTLVSSELEVTTMVAANTNRLASSASSSSSSDGAGARQGLWKSIFGAGRQQDNSAAVRQQPQPPQRQLYNPQFRQPVRQPVVQQQQQQQPGYLSLGSQLNVGQQQAGRAGAAPYVPGGINTGNVVGAPVLGGGLDPQPQAIAHVASPRILSPVEFMRYGRMGAVPASVVAEVDQYNVYYPGKGEYATLILTVMAVMAFFTLQLQLFSSLHAQLASTAMALQQSQYQGTTKLH